MFKKILSSKKFWYMVAGVIIPIISRKLGVDEATAHQMVYAFIALIIGQGMADWGKERK